MTTPATIFDYRDILSELIGKVAEKQNLTQTLDTSSILFSLVSQKLISADVGSAAERVLRLGERLSWGATITPEASKLYTEDYLKAGAALKKLS